MCCDIFVAADDFYGVIYVGVAIVVLPLIINSMRLSNTYICQKITIIGSDNGLSLGRHQAIIWTNAGILLIGPLQTNFSEVLIKIDIFIIQVNAFENAVWKMAAILSRPQCVNSMPDGVR